MDGCTAQLLQSWLQATPYRNPEDWVFCFHLIPAVNLRMQAESGRQCCLKIDLFSGDGVLEFQKLSVQQISSIAGKAGEIFKRLAA